jgi:2-oxoglutarate ferredoxin oxidoreductase subunit delta
VRLQLVGVIAQQVDRGILRATADTVRTGLVKEWAPPKPARQPLLPPQGLKLRDVDIVIIDARCKGCSYCIEFCPKKVFEESKKLNEIGIHPPRVKDSSLCVGCGVCEDICPDFAVFLVDKEETHP